MLIMWTTRSASCDRLATGPGPLVVIRSLLPEFAGADGDVIHLGPLGKVDAHRLLVSQSVDVELADSIVAQADGNPLFLTSTSPG